MTNKPLTPARLVDGQSIGSVRHLVETLNWMIGYLSNLKGVDGVSLMYGDTDHPEIRLRIEAGEGISVENEGGAVKISADGGGGGGHEYEFVSADDSNLTFSVEDVDGKKRVTVGAYWK